MIWNAPVRVRAIATWWPRRKATATTPQAFGSPARDRGRRFRGVPLEQGKETLHLVLRIAHQAFADLDFNLLRARRRAAKPNRRCDCEC